MSQPRDSQWFTRRMPAPDVLDQVLSGDPVTHLMGVARERAIVKVGLDAVADPDADEAAAAAALEKAVAVAKLLSDKPDALLSKEEQEVLDLFIMLVSRPAFFVQGGTVAERPPNWPEIGRYEKLFPRRIAGTGRLDTSKGTKIGSGFIVGDRRVMTNNHVVCGLFRLNLRYWKIHPKDFAERCQKASALWAKGEGRPTFEADGEFLSEASRRVEVKGILAHHAKVDMAILELASNPPATKQLSLADAEPEDLKGRRVYVVGFPIQRGSTPFKFFKRIFGAEEKSLGTKRFSPGTVLGWTGEHEYYHDASTLPGSSGSCLVDFAEDRVLGLHYSGWYKTQNYFVPLWKFRSDPLLVSNGVVFGD